MKLPSKPKPPELDMNKYMFLFYGREKIGKTSLVSQWPNSLFIPTEPGVKGLNVWTPTDDTGKSIEVLTSWKQMGQVVAALEKTDKFSSVIIDTVDNFYELCLDHVCEKLGIEYPGSTVDGREDYGKSWKDVRTEFVDMLAKIYNTGRGLVLTSHARETTIRPKGGMEYTKIGPTMPNQPKTIIEGLVDVFFYIDYVKDATGRLQRIIFCQGDETVWAGYRKTAGKFPNALPLLEKGGYEVIRQGFNGQHPGVNMSQLTASKLTTKTAASLVSKMRADAVRRVATVNKQGA